MRMCCHVLSRPSHQNTFVDTCSVSQIARHRVERLNIFRYLSIFNIEYLISIWRPQPQAHTWSESAGPRDCWGRGSPGTRARWPPPSFVWNVKISSTQLCKRPHFYNSSYNRDRLYKWLLHKALLTMNVLFYPIFMLIKLSSTGFQQVTNSRCLTSLWSEFVIMM